MSSGEADEASASGGRRAAKRTVGVKSGPGGVPLETVWNAIPTPSMVLDRENRIVAANASAELYFSQSSVSLARYTLDECCGADSRIVDIVAEARRGMLSLREWGVSLAWRGREPALVDLQAAALFDSEERLLLMVQPRSVAAAVDRSMAERGATRSLSAFSAMIAHEIKNPLSGISGAAQLLEMNLGDAEAELLQLIHDEVDRIRTLLDRVDMFGDSGPLERKPVNIHDVLQKARRAAAAGFARHIRFREIYDPSLPAVPGDRAQLLQAISNLLKNAAEAAPRQGGEVTLRTAFRPGVTVAAAPGGARERLPLEVTIMDNGPGVPDEILPHIFEPFVTSKSGGSGLGLALVAKIVADHGGVIDCVRQGERTAFRLMLPVWRGFEEPAGETAEGAAMDRWTTERWASEGWPSDADRTGGGFGRGRRRGGEPEGDSGEGESA